MILEFQLEASELRLDKAIADSLGDYSRSQVQDLIKKGLVTSDGKLVKASDKSREGQAIRIDLPEPEAIYLRPEDIALDIVYEDDDLMVINKPQGMVVHPGAGHHSGTLVNALLYHNADDLSDVNDEDRPGIVHRLDKDTSGLLVVAKTNQAHRILADQLQRHEVSRIYEAIVYGHFGEKAGVIDAPIARDSKNRQKMAVMSDGKPARTHFRLLASLKYGSYVRLKLETGRTHQIRVHMKFIDHPVLADPIYAPKRETFGLEGQCLHARELSFLHPSTGEKMHFEAPLPEWFEAALAKLGYDKSLELTWPDEWPDETLL